ncbi:hypothetical protein ACIBF7_19275, partial [Nonomuraea sp. NPDC050478]|uniref:hypothetical protein n=1 Tax=Nonomuraea sp. NPDC050478 TaxID=3364365 RepID=UPI00378C450C
YDLAARTGLAGPVELTVPTDLGVKAEPTVRTAGPAEPTAPTDLAGLQGMVMVGPGPSRAGPGRTSAGTPPTLTARS